MDRKLKNWLTLRLLLSTILVSPVPAIAQTAADANSNHLQNALQRIASNPNDSNALADAGLAALDMGDTQAALGFLARSDEIYSTSGRVKAGLGRALLAQENPSGAIGYFNDAVARGVSVKSIAEDRGLAYDLIGRNVDAQQDYQIALQNGKSDRLIERYAVSLGISGKYQEAEAQLAPLLYQRSRDAWRYKAFIYAMNGKLTEAEDIAKQTMPAEMAKAISPFFARMPKLTAAQKAAAVHLGRFPASENIGVDVESVRLASNVAARKVGDADAGLIPIGEPLGKKAKRPKVVAMPEARSPRRIRVGREDGTRSSRKRSKSESSAVVLAATELPSPGSSTAITAQTGGAAVKQDDGKALMSTNKMPLPEANAGQKIAAQNITTPNNPVKKIATENGVASSSGSNAIKASSGAGRTDIAGASTTTTGKAVAAGFDTPLGVSQAANLAGTKANADTAKNEVSPALVSQSVQRKVEIAGVKPGAGLSKKLAEQQAVTSKAPVTKALETKALETKAPEVGSLETRASASKDNIVAAAVTKMTGDAQSAPGATAAVSEADTKIAATVASGTNNPGTGKPEGALINPPPVAADAAGTASDIAANLAAGDGANQAASDATQGDKPLADIMKDITVPATERSADVVPVDLTKIEPAKRQLKAEPPEPKQLEPKKAEPTKAEPKKVEPKKADAKTPESKKTDTKKADTKKADSKKAQPKEPKRYWVQIATGADLAALKYDYRRMSKKHAELFKSQSGWTSKWGKTSRLVVGPFDNLAGAKKFEAGFRKVGGNGFSWVSEDGVEVVPLTK